MGVDDKIGSYNSHLIVHHYFAVVDVTSSHCVHLVIACQRALVLRTLMSLVAVCGHILQYEYAHIFYHCVYGTISS